MAKRAFWGVADQGLSSLSNFVLSLLVAHSVSAKGFGAFAIAISLYAIVLQFTRGLCGLPLSIRFSTVGREEWSGGVAAATGAALFLGLIFASVTFAVGVLIGSELGQALMALGIGLPALLLQDTWRYAFFAQRRGSAAFANDAVWTLSFLLVVYLAQRTENISGPGMILIWSAAAALAAAVACRQGRLAPRLLQTKFWLLGQRDISFRFALETVAVTGTGQFAFFLMGAILGLASLGAVRAAYTLLTPLNILFFGIMLMGVPEAARAARRSSARVQTLAVAFAAFLVALSILWSIALLQLPEAAGSRIIGELWQGSQPYVIPMSVLMALTGIQIGALVALRGLAAARMSLRAALVSSPLTLMLTAVGALTWGPAGGVWGLCIGRAITAIISWGALQLVLARKVATNNGSIGMELDH
jgi:O-antigen/teichoic acid export membrane protein